MCARAALTSGYRAIADTLPFWLIACMLTVLGAIWGSFVGVLCQRWPNGESIITGRSRCDHCQLPLRAHELVPILSYLIQRGKCRRCSAVIGRDSLLIELFCASFGLICATVFPFPSAIALAALGWVLLPLILLDWRHHWLPDNLVIVVAVTGLAGGGFLPNEPGLVDRAIGGVAGFAALQLLRVVYSRLRGMEAMGAGDPKLLGAIGLWVGWQSLPLILLLASTLGLAHFLIQFRNSDALKQHFPLGSYFGVATILLACATAALGATRLSALSG